MASTPNFNWATPDNTGLVKNGALDIRTLGNAIDASLVDLKGGTTGQVLSKASNTDMDFTWATDASGIPATIFDAKGDIIAATAADTASRLAVGTNGQVLTADSTAATGLKWASASSSAKSYSLLNSGGTALTGAATITVSGISGIEDLMIIVAGASSASSSASMTIRFSGDSGNNYNHAAPYIIQGGGYDQNNFTSANLLNTTGILVGRTGSVAGIAVNANIRVTGGNSTGVKVYQSTGGGDNAGGNDSRMYWYGGAWNNTSTISSVSIISGSGNFDAGTIYVYGAA